MSSELKERILNHARQRFLTEGFAKTTVDELTSDLSMSKKTFYQVFSGKDDLIEQIVTRQLQDVNAAMEYILSQPHDSMRKLHEIVRYMGEMLSRISRTLMTDMHRHYPQQWLRIEHFRRERLTQNITLLFEQGIAEGYVRKDANKRIFLLAYLGAIESIIQGHVLSQESFSSKEAIEAIMDIFFRGILTETARVRYEQLHQTTNQG